MKEAQEKVKDYRCFTKSHYYNPKGIPQWQMDEFNRDDEPYIATRKRYIIESIEDEGIESASKNTAENEKSKSAFNVLVKEWKEAVAHFSSERQQVSHITFHRIVALGKEVLPFILSEFSQEPIPGWLLALEAIAGIDAASNATTYKEAIQCWINWGKENSYL